jgi:hypothetical protein
VRRAARVDSTHAPIVDALRAIGCRVLSLATIGDGAPDLLVSFRGGRVLLLLECKSKGGTLTAAQKKFHGEWPVLVARSPEEAVRLVVGHGRLDGESERSGKLVASEPAR